MYRGLIPALAVALFLSTASLAGFVLGERDAVVTEARQVAALLSFAPEEREPLVLSESEMANIAKPAIVRVVTEFEGEIEIPRFDIDLETFDLIVFNDDIFRTESISHTLSGTGFFIGSDGHLATNAHVVSVNTVKTHHLNAALEDHVYEKLVKLNPSEAELNALLERVTEEYRGSDTQRRNEATLLDAITVRGTRTITVLDPSSTSTKLTDQVADGFVATPVYIHGDFYADEKDIAILKVDAQDVPTLDLGSSTEVSVGEQVHAVGFPSTGDYGSENGTLTESTYSGGTVSARKRSLQDAFDVIQTDAKIAQGSSGAPLLSHDGRVVGIVTSVSAEIEGRAGDSFAFAIPAELITNIAASEGIALTSDSYGSDVRDGLWSLRHRYCEDALGAFTRAKDGREDISVDRYVAPYETECEQIIAAGTSIDTWWERTYAALATTQYLMLVVGAAGALILGGIVLGVIAAVRRLRRRPQQQYAPVTGSYSAT